MQALSNRSAIAQFRHAQSGGVAIIFALFLVPLLLVIGAAIDYGHASSIETSLQNDLDAAVLDGARELVKSNDAGRAESVAQRRFQAASAAAHVKERSFVADKSKGTLTAKATAHVTTSFMSIIGIQHVAVTAESVASTRRAERPGRAQAKTIDKLQHSGLAMSDHKIRDLVYRVEHVCREIRSMGMVDRVPQCRAVFDGSFEAELRAKLSSGGNVAGLLPGGVRLAQ